jgi:hypothetical protein
MPMSDQVAIEDSADPCSIDGRPIQVMSFKQTGVCSEICRKVRDGEATEEQYREVRNLPSDYSLIFAGPPSQSTKP